MAITFTSTLKDIMLEVPFDMKKEFGRARPPLRVSLNGHTYRSRTSVYGGKYFIPVRKSNQDAAGVRPGDEVRASIVLDEEPRNVDPAADLRAALTKSRLMSDWDKLSYTRKKEFADVLLAAKKPETRERRVEKVLAEIRAKRSSSR